MDPVDIIFFDVTRVIIISAYSHTDCPASDYFFGQLGFQMPMFGNTQNTCITSSQSSFISDSFREAVDLTISANAPPQSTATQPTFSMPQNAPVMTFNSANPMYPPFIPKHLTDIFMQPFPNAPEPRSLDEGICGSKFLILLCQFYFPSQIYIPPLSSLKCNELS